MIAWAQIGFSGGYAVAVDEPLDELAMPLDTGDQAAGIEAAQFIEPAPPTTLEELSRRLRQTEDELATMRRSQTVLQDRSNFLSEVRERWSQAQDPAITTVDQQTAGSSTAGKWYDRLSIRGYAQFRFNEITQIEPGSFPAQHVGDRSVGDNQSFLVRRARLIFSGDVSKHLYVYLQPDFASGVPGSPDANHFAQIRDWYGDVYLDEDKVNRIRVGQSKVPYGWENMQSSSNRLPLDRTDGLNSAVRNERDLGVFYYWTPVGKQELFKYVLDEGLKGSGNYGVFGFGVYNGQGGSFTEQNDNLHLVARLTLPYQFDNCQVMEASVQAYTGRYVVLSAPILPLGMAPPIRPANTLETGDRSGQLDQRIAYTFVWYPQPLGFQTEWNWGRGPALNEEQTAVIDRPLSGGYAMVMYRHESPDCGVFFPFARYNFYEGGYKAERNAPYAHIKEWEMGLEWQFNPQTELTMQYTFTDRTNMFAQSEGESYGQFRGQLLRVQFQINY